MSEQVLYPLRFKAILKRALWGGTRLGTVLGKELGPEQDYAESWELCDLVNDQCVVVDGPLQGRTLHELVSDFGSELLGRHAGAERFPLLVKFIDACRTLSVQVHPNDEQAKRMGLGSNGKTEAWVVLEAEPGSVLYTGLKPGIDEQTLRQALKDTTVAQCLHEVAVRPGDCVLLPAGTVHAIGEGVLLAEVQQPSDVTFRLFDWERLDALGRPRRLHIEEAMDVIDFSAGPAQPIRPQPAPGRPDGWERVERLVECEEFVIQRRRGAEQAKLGGGDEFHAVMCIAGRGVIEYAGHDYPLRCGETLLLPAAVGQVVCRPTEPVELLDCTLAREGSIA